MEYRNGLRSCEAYGEDFDVDRRFLCFEEDPQFEEAARKGVGNGRQYLANFFAPKRDTGYPIRLIYFAIQFSYSNKLEEAQSVDKIFAAVQTAPAQLGIDPSQYLPRNNFKEVPRYVGEAFMGEAINEGYGLSVMERVPCGAKGLATPIFSRSAGNAQ